MQKKITFLTTLAFDNQQYGLSYVDLTTGELCSTTLEDEDSVFE